MLLAPRLSSVVVIALAAGCGDPAPTPPPPSSSSSGAVSAGITSAQPPPSPLPVYEGSAIARDPGSRFVVVADEDHSALKIIKLPLSAESKVVTLSMPGPPAQIIAQPDRLLITIREPSLLIAFNTQDAAVAPNQWKESFRTALPDDAWGLALDRSQKTAFVSSAWAHQVSAIDLDTHAVRWSASVAREPRGLLAVGGDLYVNHLIGSDITRMHGLSESTPKVERHGLAPSPLRTPIGMEPGAALGYALTASPDRKRLFVARHALGVVEEWGWYGASTIDVWNTKTKQPLLDKPRMRRAAKASDFHGERFARYWEHISIENAATEISGGPTMMASTGSRQPRHIVYRKKTDTVLVASEGSNSLDEFDALSPAPSAFALKGYTLAYEQRPVFEFPARSGAPSGIALSEDEDTAYVYCRSTDDLVAQPLEVDKHLPILGPAAKEPKIDDKSAKMEPPKPTVIRLVDEGAHQDEKDPNVELLQMGRAAFYQAASERIGAGAACASCHPDGRDDGFVWQEVNFPDDKVKRPRLTSNPKTADAHVRFQRFAQMPRKPLTDPGLARQTPMLAGRVDRRGPYGWRAESETLPDRIAHGFELHRGGLSDPHDYSSGERSYYAAAIGLFLRKGLRPPAKKTGELSELEAEGKALFESPMLKCKDCHDPKTDHTDGTSYPRIVKSGAGVADETSVTFRTPSLNFVGGTPPYFHDGSRSSLTTLIQFNADRMGTTSHLNEDQQKALVAYLGTL